MIELGMKVKDKVSGFQGIVTGVASYLTGCDRACVESETAPDKSFWIDFPRLRQVGKDIMSFGPAARTTGGGANPSERSDPRR